MRYVAKQNVAVNFLLVWQILHRKVITALLSVIIIVGLTQSVAAQSRIKDIVDFEGVRENQLVGYGLVVGLNGTGDSLGSAIFTKESLVYTTIVHPGQRIGNGCPRNFESIRITFIGKFQWPNQPPLENHPKNIQYD